MAVITTVSMDRRGTLLMELCFIWIWFRRPALWSYWSTKYFSLFRTFVSFMPFIACRSHLVTFALFCCTSLPYRRRIGPKTFLLMTRITPIKPVMMSVMTGLVTRERINSAAKTTTSVNSCR